MENPFIGAIAVRVAGDVKLPGHIFGQRRGPPTCGKSDGKIHMKIQSRDSPEFEARDATHEDVSIRISMDISSNCFCSDMSSRI